MQAGLLGHEEQPPELTLRNLHRERRKRGNVGAKCSNLATFRSKQVDERWRDDRSAKPKASVKGMTAKAFRPNRVFIVFRFLLLTKVYRRKAIEIQL